jgi:hypothetical protein
MNKSESIGNVENSVFYYVPADKVAAASKTYAILAQHQPYLKNLLPLRADIKRFRLQFKRVSILEYERLTFPARVQNFKFRIAPNIKNALMRAGENSSLIFADIDKETPVQEDLVFTVLRKELGLRGTSEPVWTTAIKEIGKTNYLNEAVKKSLPILEGKSFGNIEKYDKISNDVAMAIGEFEKKIFK